jgi:hypothetical protein
MADSKSLVSLNSTDELKKVLFLQKTITAQAKNELLAAISITRFDPNQDALEQARRFMAEEKKVLTKYAKYPTLTEYHFSPNCYDGSKWGATFGVTLLVGELIFEQLKSAHPPFSNISRQLFLLLMNELDNPQHEYLIEPLENALRFKVTSNGTKVTKDKQKQFARGLINQFVDTAITLCSGYGLIKAKKGGVAITPLGKRVLLHLVDASKFIEDMTAAHSKFQTAKPKLSMSA